MKTAAKILRSGAYFRTSQQVHSAIVKRSSLQKTKNFFGSLLFIEAALHMIFFSIRDVLCKKFESIRIVHKVSWPSWFQEKKKDLFFKEARGSSFRNGSDSLMSLHQQQV
jgi:hypothetical protein